MRTLLLPLVLALFLGCDTNKPAAVQPISIDLQGHYADTFVRVKLDGETLFSGHITTDPMFSLAAQIPTEVAAGEHLLEVDVAGQVFEAFTFEAPETVAIGISYSAVDEAVSFAASPHPFGYR